MSVVQTSYNERTADARPGQIGTTSTCDVATFVCKTSAGIRFGVAVRRNGTAADEAIVGVAGGGSSPWEVTDFLGVTVRDITREQQRHPAGFDTATEFDEYEEGAIMSVIYRGDIWVPVDGAATIGGAVAIADGTGRFSSTVGSATRAVIPAEFATWVIGQSTTDGLALLRLNGLQIG